VLIIQPFDERIVKDINKWSYPIWFIIKDNDVDCPCVNFTTHQADSNCKKCFGLGKKVKLRRVMAAHQNNRVTIRGDGMGSGEIGVISVYYTLKDVEASDEDLILDGEQLDVIQHAYAMRSDHSDPIYYKYETAPQKMRAKKIKASIKETLKGAGYDV
jgi:hypothetical protein